MFVGVLACACVVGVWRSVSRRRRARLEYGYMEAEAEELQNLRAHLLDNHVRVYDSTKDANSRFGQTCSICLDNWVNGQEVHEFQPCGHMFHAACIMNWLEQRDSCPVCRTPWSEVRATSNPVVSV